MALKKQIVFGKAKNLIRDGKVEILSILPNTIMVKVGEYICTRKKMRGYSIDTCGCTHHSKHGMNGGRCAHKDAMVAVLVMKGI